MKRVLLSLAAPLLLLAPAAHADDLTGRLLVTLRRPHDTRAHASAAVAVVARTHARRASPLVPQIGLLAVRPEAGGSLHALAGRMRADPGVASVQPEHRATPRAVPGDPALSLQEPAAGTPPGTPVEWWPAREGFPVAWRFTHGVGATIAIIDLGIDVHHPEFAGRIRKTVDQDANSDDPGHDDAGHGTHVASFACADGGNGVAGAGGAYGCGLIDERSDLTDFSVAQSIVDATDRGADAINMSFGTDGSRSAAQAIVNAVTYAFNRNVIMVAAAADSPTQEQGDPSNVLQPTGSGPDITQGKGLDVTAAAFDDRRASFAGSGTQISIAAYGAYGPASGGGPRGLFGAFPANTTDLERSGLSAPFTAPCGCRTTFQGDNRYAYLQGTSMAAPQVTAAAALVRHLNPDLTAREVITLIKRTARRPAGTAWSPDLGWGILDAGAAVSAARLIDEHAPVSQLSASRHPRHGRLTLHLQGRDAARRGLIASGLARFEVWRSSNGGRAHLIDRTRRKTVTVGVRRGGRYTFFSIAVDRAGNRESPPRRPDARVRIAR